MVPVSLTLTHSSGLGVPGRLGAYYNRELLEDRKKLILENICAADARAQEIEDKVNQAKKQLTMAEQKAAEMREQGVVAAEREKKLCISQANQEAARLNTLKDDTLRLQQQKAIQQISQQIVALSLKQARTQLETRSESDTFQFWVNELKMDHYAMLFESEKA